HAPGRVWRLFAADVPPLSTNVGLSNMQPRASALGGAGYDTRPRDFPPRLIPAPMPLVQEPSGMWIQQSKLYTWSGTAAKEAYNDKLVTGFSLLAGQGVHAALQTAEIVDGRSGTERTELWSDGSATLISLVGDLPGPRRGVASTSTTESGSSANILAWSFESRMSVPQYLSAAAFCFGSSCTSVALPNQDTNTPA